MYNILDFQRIPIDFPCWVVICMRSGKMDGGEECGVRRILLVWNCTWTGGSLALVIVMLLLSSTSFRSPGIISATLRRTLCIVQNN
jgi:hypothetical protein